MNTCIYEKNGINTDYDKDIVYDRVLEGNKDSYTLGRMIGSGAEGCVYEVQDMPEFAVKVFHDNRMANPVIRKKKEEKISFMVNQHVDIAGDNGGICLTWPFDTVYMNGDFKGYVMPRIHGGNKLCSITEKLRKNPENPVFTWKELAGIAQRLASTVNRIHSFGYVIGDMNPENILIDREGVVTITDTDSFEIIDLHKNAYYPCMGGVPEMLPPELQNKNGADYVPCFDKESDDFALAVHIFMLLMNGNHPYEFSDADGNSSIAEHIAECKYYFGKINSHKIHFPENTQDYSIVPSYIRNLFKRAFCDMNKGYAARPSAAEWASKCSRLYSEKYKICHANKKHVFRADYGKCPWCDGQSMFERDILVIARRIDNFLYSLRGDSVYGDFQWAVKGGIKDQNIDLFR